MEAIKVIWFDLWKTLRTSHCREPVHRLQHILGHGVSIAEGDQGQEIFTPDDAFLRHCLTTNKPDLLEFMHAAATTFSGSVDDEKVAAFRTVLAGESTCVAEFWDVRPTLDALRASGYTLGLISNLWPFPVEHIFETDHGLGEYFPRELRVYSFESGHRKPEPEIFLDALDRVGLSPEQNLMIGDNLQADCIGARQVGMQAALIDRECLHKPDELPLGIVHLSNLTQLPPLLTS